MSVPPLSPEADAHQADAQQPLRRLHLERRQRFGEIFLPASPIVVEDRAEFRQAHAPAHAPEPAEQARHLRIVPADDAIQVDHQDAVLHVLDDQSVDLFEVGDVDAALRGKLLAGPGVAAQRECDADRGEVAEADEPGLQDLRAGYQAVDQAPAVDRDEYRTGQRGMEERDARAQQPAAGGKLREQQDRQRTARAASRIHQQRDEEDVADQQRQQQRGQRNEQRFALDPQEREQSEDEIQAGRRQKRVGQPHAGDPQVEEQRDADEQRAADRAIDADDPEDPPSGFVDRRRQRSLLERREGGLRLGVHGQRLAHWPSAQANPLLTSACARRAAGTRRSSRSGPSASPASAGLHDASPSVAAPDCCAR